MALDDGILPGRARSTVLALLIGFAAFLPACSSQGQSAPEPAKTSAKTDDWPMFGGTPSRNMVNPFAKGLPMEWTAEKGEKKNVKWLAQLGSMAYGGPVISAGKVFVGTNNGFPRDPKIKGPQKRAVLMCFAEADGKFLWQAVHDIPSSEIFKMASAYGLCSTPAVDGNRVYYVTPSCELICADTGNGKALWRLDMMKDLEVVPFHIGNCSPLVIGDLVFAVTSNGVDDESGKVSSPMAPSFIAVNKTNGKLAWKSSLPGSKIIEGQWSNPCYAKINGKGQVIFPGGDAWLYSFEPETGKLIWKFDCNSDRGEVKEGKAPNYMVATPVVDDGKLYIGMGLYPGDHPSPGTKFSHFLCLDITRTGDVSAKTLVPKKREKDGSALVWAFGGLIDPPPKTGRVVAFGRTISTAAVHDGLAYIAEEQGYFYCLDARTGKKYWDHDFLQEVWGSPLCADGKIYIGGADGEIFIFAHGKDKKLIRQINMDELVHSTPVAANGVLYVMTRSKLYAIGKKE